ncbi:hypothetical protein [[Clostridium] colinum]|uniref:hypothetical protein n=1 Tax=[Clostridium] colinum TaxID=36835 RepID=UPI00202500A8|nr:hypothetical protein [[Clostridium] colinum]
MLNENDISLLENSSKINLTLEEKNYIISNFNTILKKCDILKDLPKTKEVFFNNIEDEIM